MSERRPTGWANYSGDCRSILNAPRKGPNYMGEWMYPVTAEYDAQSNTTRVGFSLIPPPEVGPDGQPLTEITDMLVTAPSERVWVGETQR